MTLFSARSIEVFDEYYFPSDESVSSTNEVYLGKDINEFIQERYEPEIFYRKAISALEKNDPYLLKRYIVKKNKEFFFLLWLENEKYPINTLTKIERYISHKEHLTKILDKALDEILDEVEISHSIKKYIYKVISKVKSK
jgi:hypothetical protein